MKLILSFLFVFGLILNLGFSFKIGKLYQVVSSHPHDVEHFLPYIRTVKKDGRLWIVQLKKSAPESVKVHLREVTGKEKTYHYVSTLISFSQQKSSSRMSLLVESISKENIEQEVVRLASYETRAVGTKGNQDAVNSVMQKLGSFGYEVKQICYSAKACSIIADKKGSTLPDQVLMVMAHIDSVGESFAGADDNASGTAVLLEMARVLKTYANKKTLRFFITNGEESGMLGASHYARQLANTNQIKQLALVINMDMVGYNSNGVVELETNAEFEGQARWYADIAQRFTSLKTKITIGAWGSDHVPFLRRGVNSILVIENWDTKTPCYHEACDTPDTLNYDYAAEIGKLNVAAILNKDLY